MSAEAARKRDRAIGYLEVAAAASLYGSTGIFSTLLVEEGVTPRSVALLRPMVGLIALAVAAALFQLGERLSFDAAGVTAPVALSTCPPRWCWRSPAPCSASGRPAPRSVWLCSRWPAFFLTVTRMVVAGVAGAYALEEGH